MASLIPGYEYDIFILKQQKRLLPVKRIINFVIADVSREEYFPGPHKCCSLYIVDYKRQ